MPRRGSVLKGRRRRERERQWDRCLHPPSLSVPAAFVALPFVLVLGGKDEEVVLQRQRELAAVEVQRRRGPDAGVVSFLLVPLDRRVEATRVDLPEHRVSVEAELARERLQLGVAELLLVGEEQIAHLP